jgi:hypothetical protein
MVALFLIKGRYMTIILESLLLNTIKQGRQLPKWRQTACVTGRRFYSQNQKKDFIKNPFKPSSFPNIVEEQKILAREALILNPTPKITLEKTRIQTLFRNLTGETPSTESGLFCTEKFPNWSISGSSTQGNNRIVESYEEKRTIPRYKLFTWAMSHLYSGYSNPPLVLKTMKEQVADSSTHLVNGIAYGIMSQTAKEMRDDLAKNKVDLDLNAYYQRCFSEQDGSVPTTDEAYQESLSNSIRELKEAYRLDAENPVTIYYLITQLLESGDIISGSKLSSRFVTEKLGISPDTMTFEELRAFILASVTSGRRPVNIRETINALYYSIQHQQQLDDVTEAIRFVNEHAQSKLSADILNDLEQLRWDPPSKSRIMY